MFLIAAALFGAPRTRLFLDLDLFLSGKVIVVCSCPLNPNPPC
jgi:hypothetical protein